MSLLITFDEFRNTSGLVALPISLNKPSQCLLYQECYDDLDLGELPSLVGQT